MGEFSLTHIIIVLVLFLVFFGPKRLPQLGSSLGEAIRGFKNAMSGDHGLSGPDAHTPPVQPQQQPPIQAQQIPPHFQNQNQYQNQYQNPQALHDAPAQHTSDIQNAQYTTTDDKNRGGQS